MHLGNAKATIDSYKKWLVENANNATMFSPSGPANMGVIDALFSLAAQQDKRIADLEAIVSRLGGQPAESGGGRKVFVGGEATR
jgi:hypothetical protein